MEPGDREAARRRALPARPSRVVSLVDWLEADGRELVDALRAALRAAQRSRFLRRNALVAAGNVGGAAERAAVAAFAESDDELLSEHAGWALERIDERIGA